MTSEVVRTWQQVLDQLSSMATSMDTDSLRERLQRLRSNSDLPKATWKALIQDMQLPRQLGLLGCSLLAEDPYKSGPMVPDAFAATVILLLDLSNEAGICAGGQLEALSGPAQQQMFDSGLLQCLQQLMEATAEQLERCTAAAAAAAAPAVDAEACIAAAAAVIAGAHPGAPSALNSTSNTDCLTYLQNAASGLLYVCMVLHSFFTNGQEAASSWYSKLASTAAAAMPLMVAGMQHISAMLLHQQQQHDPPAALTRLALHVGKATFMVANCLDLACGLERELQILLGMGPHLVVWSDLALLLTTYCYTLKQQHQLPGIEGATGSIPHKRTGKAAAAAAAAASGVTCAATSSNSSSTQQQQQRHASGSQQGPQEGFTSGLAVWCEAQSQWGRIPASHKALLQLLRVSSEAAVWVATIMAHTDVPCFPPTSYWQWNPHYLVSAAKATEGRQICEVGRPTVVPPALVQELEPQLQLWKNTPYRTLLQLLLLYGVEHTTGGGDEFICCCWDAFRPTELFLRQQLDAIKSFTQQQMGTAGESNCIPAMSPTVQDELLLLTLRLLQRLRETGSTSSSTPAARASGVRIFVSGAARTRWLINTEAAGVNLLLSLVDFAHLSKPTQRSAEAAGCGSYYPSPHVFTQQAGAIFAACESLLRAQGTCRSNVVNAAAQLAGWCCLDSSSQPNLLLRLAMQGSSAQQQVAFFNLLLTLLKLSVTPPFSVNAPGGGQCRCAAAIGALDMLQVSLGGSETAATAAASVSGVSSSCCSSSTQKSISSIAVPLWLLLLGRCSLQWAAELGQLQAEGADWAQLIRQARQQQGQKDVVPRAEMLARYSTLSVCFDEEQPLLLSLAQDGMSLLRLVESSSNDAGLAATGYDMDAVLQAFEALAACYPGVLMVQEPGNSSGAVAVADSVAGLTAALEAVGKVCSVFAVPHCCNNPGCSNLAGASELVLVSGKGCICGGCKVARYCGKACQRAHWKQHKPICKMLSAAAPV